MLLFGPGVAKSAALVDLVGRPALLLPSERYPTLVDSAERYPTLVDSAALLEFVVKVNQLLPGFLGGSPPSWVGLD